MKESGSSEKASACSRLLIVAPGNAESARHAPDEAVVEAVTDPWALITTRRPEHSVLRASLQDLRQRSVAIAEPLDAAMHPEVRGGEFWADFAGEFAMSSMVPLLATRDLVEGLVAQGSYESARIVEEPRQICWWTGLGNFGLVAGDVLEEAGIRRTTSPGWLLNGLRKLALSRGARWQGHGDALEELGRMRLGEKTADADVRECDVLFIGIGASSVQIIANLWQPLTEEHGLRCAVLDYHYDGFTAAIQRRGLPRYDIGQFVTEREIAEIVYHKWAARWPLWYRHYLQHQEDVAAFACLPPGLKSAIDRRMKMVLARHPELWRVRKVASERALDELSPKVVVSLHSYPAMATALVRYADELGISKVMLQHGSLGDWHLLQAASRFDEALVWGSHGARLFAWQLGPDTKITQTGHSAYDRAARANIDVPADVAALREAHSALVVLATQPNEAEYYDDYASWWMSGVAEACRELGAALVVKVHPSDPYMELYEKLAAAEPDTVTIVEHGTYGLDELLAAADAMVTRSSTAVFEANLIGTATMTVDLSGRDDRVPYAKMGGAVGVYERDEILPQLRRMLLDEEFRESLRQTRDEFMPAHVGPTDGKATQRISSIIAGYASATSTSA